MTRAWRRAAWRALRRHAARRIVVAMATQRHTWIIDSIEERVAAIEVDGDAVVRLPQWVLPRGAREGDVLTVSHELDADGERSTLRIAVDPDATERALGRSRRQTQKGRKSPGDAGGDITL